MSEDEEGMVMRYMKEGRMPKYRKMGIDDIIRHIHDEYNERNKEAKTNQHSHNNTDRLVPVGIHIYIQTNQYETTPSCCSYPHRIADTQLQFQLLE